MGINKKVFIGKGIKSGIGFFGNKVIILKRNEFDKLHDINIQTDCMEHSILRKLFLVRKQARNEEIFVLLDETYLFASYQ